MTNMSTLFKAVNTGESGAFDRLFGVLYPELKVIARARLRRASRLTMMDTTLLVHECFLRFQKLNQVAFEDRQHFLAYAARVIRTVIVDIVRAEQSEKRGGPLGHDTLDTAHSDGLLDERSDILDVAQALESLAAVNTRLATIVELRFFAGFNETEIATTLEISERTVRRDWEKARAFLIVELRR